MKRKEQTIVEKEIPGREHAGYAYIYPLDGGARQEYVLEMTPENIANFIGAHQYDAEKIILTDMLDNLILDTAGGFIMNCPDQILCGRVLPLLAPIQMGRRALLFFVCAAAGAPFAGLALGKFLFAFHAVGHGVRRLHHALRPGGLPLVGVIQGGAHAALGQCVHMPLRLCRAHAGLFSAVFHGDCSFPATMPVCPEKCSTFAFRVFTFPLCRPILNTGIWKRGGYA